MEYCNFTTEQEIIEAVEAVKMIEKERKIKFSKKEFDNMVLTLIDPLLTF